MAATPILDPDAQLASIEADEKLNLLDLPRITAQQKVYVAARVSGLSSRASAERAGACRATGLKWERDEVIQAYIAKYEEEMEKQSLPRVRFGIEDAHAMYMQAYHMSATAAEMVKATDSLVKLHRLNEVPTKELPTDVTPQQLADLPVSELMRLAGLKVQSLQPELLEGQFEEVED